MKLLLRDTVPEFLPRIIFSILLFCIFGFFFVNILRTENQKIRIECIKAKDTCIIEKSVKPYHIQFKASLLTKVEKEYVSRRGGCYDIKFVLGSKYNYHRLYGAGFCSGNVRNLNLIVYEFTNYIKNRDEYLLIKLGDDFYFSFIALVFLLLLLFIFWSFFVFFKSQELYLDVEKQILHIDKYYMFNICLKKEIKLSGIREFFVSKLSLYGTTSYQLKYKHKNSKKIDFLTVFEEENKAYLICEKLNKALNL